MAKATCYQSRVSLPHWVGYLRATTSGPFHRVLHNTFWHKKNLLATRYHREMAELTGFLLAGGRSGRMGRDKAFVSFQGRTLLDRALSTLRTVTPEIVVVGPRDKFVAFGTVVEDVFPGAGPLAGIHAALRSSQTDLNLMFAVDLPLVRADLLRYLIARAEHSAALVTVPRTADGWQPLCAVYRKAFADKAEPALTQGRNKVDALFTPDRLEIITEQELSTAGFSAGLFKNVNTPDDLGESR
jgi:molybdopterin-guanine dinucleotide biosynthesis protein A